MNRNKRLMAGVAALAVAAVGVAGLQGLANAYGPTSTSLAGSLFLGNTTGGTTATTNNTYTAVLTLSQSPANPNAGQSVTVTLVSATGPFTGPVGVNANSQVISSVVNVTGAQTASVQMYDVNSTGGTACAYPVTNIGTTSNQGGWTTEGTYTASGNGAASIKLNQIFFDDQGNGAGGSTNLCAGTANNADYYVSDVTQTAGSSLPGLAKTAPANSNTVAEAFTITGPNAAVTFVGGTVTGAGSYTRGSTGDVRAATKNTSVGTVNLAGTVWGASRVSADFTVQLCNSAGSSCDATAVSTNGKVLETDASGNLTGRIAVLTGNTSGVRAIKITEGTNVSLTPLTILGSAAASISPTSGGPGTVVALTGSNSLPLSRSAVSAQIANPAGFYGLSDGTPGSPLCTGFGAPAQSGSLACTAVGPYIRGSINQYVSPLPTTSSTGVLSASPTVSDSATTLVGFSEKTVLCNSSGSSCAPTNTNVDVTAPLQAGAASTAFTVNQDQCIAYTGDLTGGAGCTTAQNVSVSVLQGNLTQRVYVNAAATSGSSNSAATTPVVGTANTNSDATTVNLGTITSPFAPAVIAGTLNDITVSDNRGGTNGWSLTATGTGFTGVPSGTIAASALTATPSCAAATSSTAWDYSAVGKTAISGFDASLNAGGITAGSAAQAFGSTVNLCTKSTAVNATTGSTGGVYNVTSSLSLTVPAFQKAARYTAIVTVTLA